MKSHSFATVCLTVLFSFSISNAVANNSEYQIVKQRKSLENSTIPTYVEYTTNHLPSVSNLKDLFSNYWENPNVFGFLKVGEEKDQLGFIHYRYKQTYKGIPIEFAELIIHTKNEKIYSWNGKLLDKEPTEGFQTLSEKEALDYAKKYIGADTYKWELEAEEKFIKLEQNNLEATFYPQGELRYISNSLDIEPSKLKLAYQFKVYAHEPESHTEIYINSSNGNVLFTNNLIHTTNVKGKATTGYSGVQTINTDSVNSSRFTLNQTVHGNGINTYDANRTTSFSNTVFTDTDNDWNNVNAQLDEYATDAHWGAEMTYIYLDSSFDRNSIDDQGFTLNSYVHYDNNLSNASWDGNRMRYGDGNGVNTNPYVALDIAGHEIAHGLTSRTANLVYASEQGALNESFSDIFGASIEFFARPNRADWQIGEDVGRTIRDMSNPNAFGDPHTRGGNNWINVIGCVPNRFTNNNCGVHTNSGVQNFWFYLLSEGGTGTNDNGQTYDVTGIGVDSAAAIAYRNLVVYLNRTSNYDDARFYSIQAAIDLFGPCSQEVESVMDAWYAVGIGKEYSPGVAADFYTSDSLACSFPHRVVFEDLSNNGINYKWFFGDGDSSILRNPVHVYQDTGKYDVTLFIDGGSCGRDTLMRTSYIDINENNLCEVVLQDGANALQTDCSGKIFDTGGGNDVYGPNENATITISPIGASKVTLDFIQFDVESGRTGCTEDILEVFDGPSVNSPSLGQFCSGRFGNVPSTITSTFGSITIRFTSNSTVNQDGFEIDWKCSYPTTPPNSDFIVSTDTSCTGFIKFTDQSTEVPNKWEWDFGDGILSTDQNPTHIYEKDGDYDVQLISTNDIGSDTLIKKALIHIERPDAPAGVGGTACFGGDVALTVLTNNEKRWYRQETGGSPISSSDSIFLTGLTSDSSMWVEEVILDPTQNVGPIDSSIGTGVYFNNAQQHLVFDVLNPIVLKTVKVHSNRSGLRIILLRDENGTVIRSARPNIPLGESRINLNFEIDPGTNYELAVSSSTGAPNLWRNNGGVSYPYEIDDLISIKTSSAGNNFYYFFYDWEVKGQEDCVSPRTEVKAFIDTSCSAPLFSDFSVSTDSTCNGTVSFTNLSAGPSTFQLWDFGDGNTSTARNPFHIYTSNGDFDVQLLIGNIAVKDSVKKENAINVDRPISPEVQNDTTCFRGYAVVKAINSGNVRWYENEFGGAPISFADTIEIDTLRADTSFWVERIIQSSCISPRKQVFARVDSSCEAFIGISEEFNPASHVLIYPNPANYSVTIDYKQLEDIQEVNILDITGKSIYNEINPKPNGLSVISTIDFSSGIYFVRIRTSKLIFTEKISVRH